MRMTGPIASLRRHRCQHLQRGLGVLVAAQQIGGQQSRRCQPRPQVQRQPQHQHGILVRILRPQCAAERQISLCHSVGRPGHRAFGAGGLQRWHGDGHVGRAVCQRGEGPLRRRRVAGPCLPARQDLRQPQVHLRHLGLGDGVKPRRVLLVVAEISDHRGVQRENPTEPLAGDERAQGRQGGIGLAGTGLRPGNQKRSEKLGQALLRQRMEAFLCRRPISGAGVLVRQQKLRNRVVRQLVGELHRLRSATHDRGEERLLQQVRIAWA